MTKLHNHKWYQNNTSHGFGFLFLSIKKTHLKKKKNTNSTPINVSNHDKPSSEGLIRAGSLLDLPQYYWSKLVPWQWLLGHIIGWLMLSTWTNLQLLVSGLDIVTHIYLCRFVQKGGYIVYLHVVQSLFPWNTTSCNHSIFWGFSILFSFRHTDLRPTQVWRNFCWRTLGTPYLSSSIHWFSHLVTQTLPAMEVSREKQGCL